VRLVLQDFPGAEILAHNRIHPGRIHPGVSEQQVEERISGGGDSNAVAIDATQPAKVSTAAIKKAFAGRGVT
jgi:hypothetical protein